MKKKIAGFGLLAPTLVLSACAAGHADDRGSDSSRAAGQVSTASGNGGAAIGAAVAGVTATKEDVTIDSCTLGDNGAVVVKATLTNSGGTAAGYIASVEIQQDGRRVDGMGLIASGLEAGTSTTSSETGTKTGLKGKVTCEVTEVSALAG